MPQNGPHVGAVHLFVHVLEQAWGPGLYVRAQFPLSLDDHSEPEPDVAVVRGSPRDYRNTHPSTALLVVEVADSSLAYDLVVKARLYAGAGIPEYRVLDLAARVLHVHRSPGSLTDGEVGYAEIRNRFAGERVTPQALSGAAIEVADLLP